jgi:hypothetical protein
MDILHGAPSLVLPNVTAPHQPASSGSRGARGSVSTPVPWRRGPARPPASGARRRSHPAPHAPPRAQERPQHPCSLLWAAWVALATYKSYNQPIQSLIQLPSRAVVRDGAVPWRCEEGRVLWQRARL